MITVVVNGEARQVGDVTTVEELAAGMGAGPSGVAVAVNDEVVPRSVWAARRLADADRVEVLGAMQGG